MAREPARKAMDHARWISWEDAWKQGQRVVGNLELVAAQLKQGLVGEKIPAIDQIITEGGKVETLDLSAPEFWEQVVYIAVEHGLGDYVGWFPRRGRTLPCGIAQKSKHTIFLGREAINAMWPIEPTAPADKIARPYRRKTGPPPTHDWQNQLMPELIRIVHDEGIPKTDSALAQKLRAFCKELWKDDWQPEESYLRKWIRHALSRLRPNSP